MKNYRFEEGREFTLLRVRLPFPGKRVTSPARLVAAKIAPRWAWSSVKRLAMEVRAMMVRSCFIDRCADGGDRRTYAGFHAVEAVRTSIHRRCSLCLCRSGQDRQYKGDGNKREWQIIHEGWKGKGKFVETWVSRGENFALASACPPHQNIVVHHHHHHVKWSRCSFKRVEQHWPNMCNLSHTASGTGKLYFAP